MARTKKTTRKAGQLTKSQHIVWDIVDSFDHTPISYQSHGKSAYPLVCFNGLGVAPFFWVYFEEYFQKLKIQTVTWDYRGHGDSGLLEDVNNYSLNALVQDSKAVMDALKIKQPVLIGHSLGAQVILEFYRQYPKQVKALILCFSTDGRPMNTFYNMRISRYVFELCYKVSQSFPAQSRWISRLLIQNPLSFYMGGLLKIMNTGMVDREKIDQYIEHILQVNPVFFTRLLKSAQEHSCQDMLPTIKVPTLIIAGEEDHFTPLWISKKMHRLIPDSELFIIKKGSHAALVEQPELINLRVEKFLNERVYGQKKSITKSKKSEAA